MAAATAILDVKIQIESLATKAEAATKAEEALKFSQAALNLAQAFSTLAGYRDGITNK